MKIDTYKKAFRKDKKIVNKYFKKLKKSEQQKMLENLLLDIKISNNIKISDIGCGGGKSSYYMNLKYPKATYYLVDYNKNAILEAKKINNSSNFNFKIGNIYNLEYKDNFFDVTTSLVVISFLEDTQKAIDELIRVTKKGGHIFISALINFEHDVDLITKVLDHTRNSAKDELYLTYNTFSKKTLKKWISPKVKKVKFHKFNIKKELRYDGKGIDTYTINTENGKIQIAGGMRLNWGFIHIEK